MEYRLSKYVNVKEFKEGLALFDSFRGDTHFIPYPQAHLIKLLQQQTHNSKQLCATLTAILDDSEEAPTDLVETFIIDALAADIIVEV
ncbi:MAG: PqqD family protein of HPr-rel-A system [Paraglaciecola sp.]|jgi:PqqD family protein of HPr-rel-A system